MDAAAAVAFGGIATNPQLTPQIRAPFSLAARIDQIREALRINESNELKPLKRPRVSKTELTPEEAETLLSQMVEEKLSQAELLQALAELGMLWKQNKMPPLSEKAQAALFQLANRLYTLIYPEKREGVDLTVDERATDYVRTLLSAACKGSFKTTSDARALPQMVRGFLIHAALMVPNLLPFDRLRQCADFSCPGMLLLPLTHETFLGMCRALKERHEQSLNTWKGGIIISNFELKKILSEIHSSEEDLASALLANKQRLMEDLDEKLKIEEVVKVIEIFAKLMNDARCEQMTPGVVEVMGELLLLLRTELMVYFMFHIVAFDFSDYAIHEAFEPNYPHLLQRTLRAVSQLPANPKIAQSLCDIMSDALHHASFQDPISFGTAPVLLEQQIKDRVWQTLSLLIAQAKSDPSHFAQRMTKILHLLAVLAEPKPQFLNRMRTVLTPLIPLGSESRKADASNAHALFSAFVKDCAENLPTHDCFNVLTLFNAMAMFADNQIIPHEVHESLSFCLEPEGVEISNEMAESLGIVYMSGMLDACSRLQRHDKAPPANQLRYLFQLLNHNLHAQPSSQIACKTLLALGRIVQACMLEARGKTEVPTLLPQAERALYQWWQAIDLHLLDAQEILKLLEAMGVLIEAYPPQSDVEQMAILSLLSQAANHHLLAAKNLEQTGKVLNNLDKLLKKMTVGRLSIPVGQSLEQLRTQVAGLLQRRQHDGRGS